MKLSSDHHINGFGVMLNDLRFTLTDRSRQINHLESECILGTDKYEPIRFFRKRSRTFNIQEILKRLGR